MNLISCVAMTGVIATLVMDGWGVARQTLLGAKPPNYRLVGRWLGHMPRGRFKHDAIAAAPRVEGERAIGWIAHYATGIVFAWLLIAIVGADWLRQPSLWPALGVGIATVAAPFLLMQPGMGAGVAASKMPRPATARRQSLVTHAIFGIGLYLGGWCASLWC